MPRAATQYVQSPQDAPDLTTSPPLPYSEPHTETSATVVRPNFEKYTAKAHEVRDILADYDPRFESASIDEAYLNITEYCAQHTVTAEEAVQQMRDEIHEKTKITVSAGIAANAKLAKICSNFNKPNGQYSLPNDRNAVITFMRDLPTRKVNGIGRVFERELQEIDIRTCGDIYPHRHLLHQLFGEKTYHFLVRCYLGLGRTQVQPAEEYERKSVGTESTFRDISDPAELGEKLRWTAGELEKDMQRAECKGRTLVLKVKLHTFEVLTRQVVLPKAISQADDLYQYSLPILTKLQHESESPRMQYIQPTFLILSLSGTPRSIYDQDLLTVQPGYDSAAYEAAPNGPSVYTPSQHKETRCSRVLWIATSQGRGRDVSETRQAES